MTLGATLLSFFQCMVTECSRLPQTIVSKGNACILVICGNGGGDGKPIKL